MAKAMQLQPDLVRGIWTSKPNLAEGERDDIKNIWDTVGLRWIRLYQTSTFFLHVGFSYKVEKPDADRERLEQILGMSEAELAADENDFFV